MTAREKMAALTNTLNRQLGINIEIKMGPRDVLLTAEGTPADVATFRTYIEDNAEVVEHFNGDESADEDYHGWAFLHFNAAR